MYEAIFDSINASQKKLLSDVMFWLLSRDVTDIALMSEKCNINEQVASKCLEIFKVLNIVECDADNKSVPMNRKPYYVSVSKVTDLHPEVLKFLTENGHDLADITNIITGLPRDQKTKLSNILSDETYEWHDATEAKPDNNKIVAIRLMDPNQIYVETRSEVMYVEDIQLAYWISDEIEGVAEWFILGPFPKYDFSLLSDHESINEGVEVTHWADVSNEAITRWTNRLNPHNTYKHLELRVDDEHGKAVYQALLLSAGCTMHMANSITDDDSLKAKLSAAYSIMCDLQAALDMGVISNMKEGTDDAMDN